MLNYCFLHFLSIFYIFTRMNHRMIFNAFPVNVQGGNRKCRNRHVAETTAIHFQLAFQVGTCNMQLPGALSPRRRIHFPNPSAASKIIKVGSGLQLQVLPIRSNTRSKSFLFAKKNCCLQHNFKWSDSLTTRTCCF